jgi:predicted transcriptional regulator
MKIQTKVFLPGDIVRALDEASRRLRKPKSEIVRAAIASYLSADSVEAGEAAITRRLDRMSRQIERLERDVTISNEAIALYVKTWLKSVPQLTSNEDPATVATGRERYGRFVEALARRLSLGKRFYDEVSAEHAGVMGD